MPRLTKGHKALLVAAVLTGAMYITPQVLIGAAMFVMFYVLAKLILELFDE